MLDCLIKGGSLVDGLGAPARPADVAIRDGRVTAVGAIDEPARRTIDADSAVVAPGFIDIHTHYDAQILWDGTLSPSPLHGVTTVVGGNCGFSIAPLRPEAADYLRRMLARVEGMPLESLEAGAAWDWQSFGEWLDRLEGRTALNAGFLVGHSALRRVVMGEAAVGESASPAQIGEMVALLHEALRAGGLGFSSSRAATHNDGAGQPVPSRFATTEEFLALAQAVGEHPGTTLELIPTIGTFQSEDMELMAGMSRAANRPLNWNVLQPSLVNPDLHQNQLSASDYAAEHGGRVVALTLPQVMELRLSFLSGFVLDALPGWAEIIALAVPERIRALQDPQVREQLKKGARSEEAGVLRALFNWERMRVVETFSPANRELQGRSVGDLARETGKDAFELMLDLAVSEELRTSFTPYMPPDSDESLRLKAEIWKDPRTVVGASDAGAHLDMVNTFSYTTWLLGTAVREKSVLSLEEAVHQLTEVPARLYGIRGRGRVTPGAWADLVVFDPQTIAPKPAYTRNDLPGAAGRLYGEAEGIRHVLVNGHEILRDGVFSDARPGTLLRSGRDTETVNVH